MSRNHSTAMIPPAVDLSVATRAATQPEGVLVIGGPTASGKSGLALALARQLGGVVINADSMQIYRDLTIITARPDSAALEAAPHRLYGILPGSEPCSAARWRTLALAEIAAAHDAHRLPIVVGGTGLYLRALLEGLSAIPDIPPDIRSEARGRLEELGPSGLHAELAGRDPLTAARLRPGDSQRVVRAWEVLHATGRPLALWQAEGTDGPPPGLIFSVIVLDPPRAALYEACNGRFRAMMAAGAVDEVRALDALALAPGLPVLKALGVPELRRHLAGTLPLEDAIALAEQSTRRYAKRQVTWFHHQVITRTTNQPVTVLKSSRFSTI